MRRFVEEAHRGQWTLLPKCLDEFIDESNPVRVIDAFVDAFDLSEMGFEGGAGSQRSTVVPPLCSPEALHLWLSEPGAVEPTARTGDRDARRWADCGYFNSPEILACQEAGITVSCPSRRRQMLSRSALR